MFGHYLEKLPFDLWIHFESIILCYFIFCTWPKYNADLYDQLAQFLGCLTILEEKKLKEFRNIWEEKQNNVQHCLSQCFQKKKKQRDVRLPPGKCIWTSTILIIKWPCLSQEGHTTIAVLPNTFWFPSMMRLAFLYTFLFELLTGLLMALRAVQYSLKNSAEKTKQFVLVPLRRRRRTTLIMNSTEALTIGFCHSYSVDML